MQIPRVFVYILCIECTTLLSKDVICVLICEIYLKQLYTFF